MRPSRPSKKRFWPGQGAPRPLPTWRPTWPPKVDFLRPKFASILGRSWGSLEESWRGRGGVLEASWRVLGRSWGHFGASWGLSFAKPPLRPPKSTPRAPQDTPSTPRDFKKSLQTKGKSMIFEMPPTAARTVSWVALGALLGGLGASWGPGS